MKIFGMHMQLSEYDRTLGLIICGAAMVVMFLLVLSHLVFGFDYAETGAIAVISWWFGATMTWLIEKHLRYLKK